MTGEVQKFYYTYDQIHETIGNIVTKQDLYEKFKPTVILAIGGGGFIPARILRTFLKEKSGKSIPIQAIGLVLYDDDLDMYDASTAVVRKTQWLDYTVGLASATLQGHNILIVDEVDDTRKTLSYAIAELQKDIDAQRDAHSKSPQAETNPWQEPNVGVLVVHNKLKEKRAELPANIMDAYFAGENIEDKWVVYPWDAINISDHTSRALAQER